MRHSAHFEPGQPPRTAAAALRDWLMLTFGLAVLALIAASLFQSVRLVEVGAILSVVAGVLGLLFLRAEQ